MTPRECQVLWKFLAYGRAPPRTQQSELLPDSDEEEIHKTPGQINAELAAAERELRTGGEMAVKAEQQEQVTPGEPAAQEKEAHAAADGDKPLQDGDDTQKDQAESSAVEQGAVEQQSEPLVRLYPTYSLPTGAPDAWKRPFTPKDALPLTFVASRFLKRKANPPLTHSVFSHVAVATPSSTSAAADLKRKQALVATSAAAKKTKLDTPPVSTPPRVFTPSSTPPPAAQRARSELEFFELRLRKELAKSTPGSKFELSAADIQRRFGESSQEVRLQCKTLAAQDVERYNREVVRARIWQKAMGANGTKAQPTLASAPAAAAKPTPSPPAASTKPVSAVSAGMSAAGSRSTPPAKSSGPTAALLAHAAAVAAIAAKGTSNQTEISTTSVPKTVQGQKDEDTATTKSETK
ncbi:unnamed protein product [Phytophthora fragariaefolia]|uniref:Unnamed protein product n=1 Tax=Phytophthora fragariaefolia TaxID=1490495 RepID=A0A9W7CVF0_9STRA|nr:unnamed protein product [Phytophthora fragariaefolia]